jgi:putative effector of murein hydrolase LrgA (UPF0299 family)
MLDFFVLLVVCQLAGEVLRVATGAPLSGPIIGMGLLFALLLGRGGLPPGLKDVSQAILQHLALLFVPAAVGVVVYLPRLRDEWLAIAAALVGSTVITVVVTAVTMRTLLRLSDARRRRVADAAPLPSPGVAE